MTERTYVMIKPDGVQRRLIGEIVSRIERKGLSVMAMKLAKLNSNQIKELYKVHEGKPFYNSLVSFISSGHVVAFVIGGYQAVSVMRSLMGETFGFKAQPGTIRGDYGVSKGFNLIHGSDSPESAAREIPIIFSESEIIKNPIENLTWINEEAELK